MTIKKIATICACLCALFVVLDFFRGFSRYGGLSQDIALLTIAFFFFVLRNKTNK